MKLADSLPLALGYFQLPRWGKGPPRRANQDAKGDGGYVLMPTSAPINEPLSPQTEQNYFAWIDAGLKYGSYS